MFRDLTRYALAAWRFPPGHSLGFIRMGFGIEQRADRYRDAWRSHIEASQSAQRRWLADLKGRSEGSAMILGAGRLYDCALHDLCRCYKTVDLVDADSSCLSTWKRVGRSYPENFFTHHIVEVTGQLAAWRVRLVDSAKGGNWSATLRTLEGLADAAATVRTPLDVLLSDRTPEAVLSLNLMSQLPVMWQDIVERILRERFGRAEVNAREEEWIAAYVPTARHLVREHLRSLSESSAEKVLILTDVEYLSYPHDRQRRGLPPVTWVDLDESGRWRSAAEGASREDDSVLQECSLMDALAGVKIENSRLLAAVAPGRQATLSPSWLWHICPVPEGGKSTCAVHRVRAVELRRVRAES